MIARGVATAMSSDEVESAVQSTLRRIRHCCLAGLLAALAGCAVEPVIMAGNYLTYDHDFTEAAAADVRMNAEKLCGQRKQAAVQTRSVCTLKRCVTDYQCVNPKDPLEYNPPGILNQM